MDPVFVLGVVRALFKRHIWLFPIGIESDVDVIRKEFGIEAFLTIARVVGEIVSVDPIAVFVFFVFVFIDFVNLVWHFWLSIRIIIG